MVVEGEIVEEAELGETHQEGAEETCKESWVAEDGEGKEWGEGGEVRVEEEEEETCAAEDEGEDGGEAGPGEGRPAPREGHEEAGEGADEENCSRPVEGFEGRGGVERAVWRVEEEGYEDEAEAGEGEADPGIFVLVGVTRR